MSVPASRPLGGAVHVRARADEGAARAPAQRAAGRLFLASVALGALALGAAVLVLAQTLHAWRLGARQAHDSVVVLGVRLGYPAANASAIVLAVLAGFGLLVVVAAARAIARELLANARFQRSIVRAHGAGPHGARIIEDPRLHAFCAGFVHPRVYLSRGAVELLEPRELAAVLAHESHHARRRDPLRLAATRVLAEAVFFLPPLRRLISRQHDLVEIGADEAALAAGGGARSALASAMLRFSEHGDEEPAGLAPERVDHLVGERLAWQFPLASFAAVACCLAALLAVIVLASRSASGSATLALPLLSSQPCVVMLAALPAATALAGLRCARRRPRARRQQFAVTGAARD